MPVVTVLGKHTQENHAFQVSLGDIMRLKRINKQVIWKV